MKIKIFNLRNKDVRRNGDNMTVFRYEWKSWQKYISIWAAVLSICIFFMTPVYYGMLGEAEALPENFAQGGYFEMVGTSLELLIQPLGMYSFLTGFFMLAGGIFGMYLGLSLYTKECTENTAEYLFTKPCGRRTIYKGKALCMLCGVGIVGTAYLLASFLTMLMSNPGFSAAEFLLVALSFFLVTLFFGVLGLLTGICRSNNRSPLLTAGLVVFLEYCITTFSRTVGIRFIGFFSPFTFFSPSAINQFGFYEWDYFVWYVILIVVFSVSAYKALLKRDIAFVV